MCSRLEHSDEFLAKGSQTVVSHQNGGDAVAGVAPPASLLMTVIKR
jgi:hypothetical protein